MLTRAKNGICKPKVFLSDLTNTEPSNIQEALAHNQWNQAVQAEYNALVKNKTWYLTPLPPIVA